MATIVDSLLVTLGLDDKPYKKGAAEADRAQKQFKDNSKKTNSEITDQLKSVTRQIALMVIGFESLKGAATFLAGINNADAALGRLAANTGTNVHELNLWGNAVKLAGGDAKEAQGDVANLAQSITQMKAGGDVSPLLLLMQRLGVAIFDAEGKTRNLFDILTDAGGKLRQFKREDAAQLGRGAGLSEGTLNLLLEEEAVRKKTFADAERANNLDAARAKQAQEIQTAWRGIQLAAENFGRALLEKITPGLMAFFHALEPIEPILLRIVDKFTASGVFEGAANAMVKIAEYAERAVDALLKLKGGNVEPGDPNAPAHMKPQSSADLLARSPVPGETQEVYDFRMRAAKTRKREVELERQQYGIAAAARLAGEQIKIAARNNEPGARGQAQTLGIQIDEININTQATDADGIATDIRGALTSKISQADSGLN